jgi:hypothetical protein
MGRLMSESFDAFHEMKRRGENAASCCRAAQDAGLGFLMQIRMLREVFGLSLVQAKEKIVVADGRWASLEDYQESLLPTLEEAFQNSSESA